ncbi:protein FAR1-RELATED SEQUENCE 3-like [Salvia hispanica]|uniref:protein FAR1-RELATED SEQUENCE 3-like n=1 Tax=Salvia hispanica TaxID=49212 RepID=UPI00200967B5|nr:protein FAR1-RELATED SEQUENCE 3-like [Salvia hispanica]
MTQQRDAEQQRVAIRVGALCGKFPDSRGECDLARNVAAAMDSVRVQPSHARFCMRTRSGKYILEPLDLELERTRRIIRSEKGSGTMGDRTDIEKLQEMVKLLMDERDAERAAREAMEKKNRETLPVMNMFNHGNMITFPNGPRIDANNFELRMPLIQRVEQTPFAVFVIPECSPQLKPVIGQKFQSLDFAFAFYDVYARSVGFDTRKQGMRKAADGVTTWYSVVCNREGCKRSNEEDDVNARSGFTLKRRRLSKRCGCKACISFKPHTTFKVLKEILGGFELVGCNVGGIRNTSRDIKAFAHGCDVQMVLDDMSKKKELSDAFTYHYEVNAANQLVALFWCDGLMKRNYHMFGDIVAFDSTYNTNRYCMIFTPFTGKDNHGKPVTFAAGLVCNEKTGAFAWLFKHFVECMGVAPKMIVTDQDLGMRSAIQERNARTKLDYNDATSVPILATKLGFEKHAATLYTDSMFGKIQEEIVDGNDRCRVLGFSSTDTIDTYKLGDSRRNSSASRLVSKREKAIKEAVRPLRRCKACDELDHHDSRNCPMLKEMEKEKALSKGKRKA